MREQIILLLKQPMTSTQLRRRLSTSSAQLNHTVVSLRAYKLIECVNPKANRSRLFWLSELGKNYQNRLRVRTNKKPLAHDLPDIDWELYGWLCYSHRATVLRTLNGPMQPAKIKRIALRSDPTIKMSANNCRDVIKEFLQQGIVQIVEVRHKLHKRFELTSVGVEMQRLLLIVETATCE